MKIKILYIEDNDQNFYLVSFIMSAKGYEVKRAHDGREGIDLAIQEKPDLILLDIQLPIMDGYATARELRKIPGVSTTPIVALTSYAMAGDREKALEAGCTGYIEKPINPKTFTEQIQQFLPSVDSTGAGK
ncbi:response regulator [uncultured Methanoregula sp.]|uniref:response regulator n=1 Tax=uncultured Methanoregula sp. TaxID=1005933 RepID=UPI002AAA89E9|nr:response regulator [uncultured Methanoregula sp.]